MGRESLDVIPSMLERLKYVSFFAVYLLSAIFTILEERSDKVARHDGTSTVSRDL